MPSINAQQLVDMMRLYQAPQQQPPPGPPLPQAAPGNIDPRLYGMPVAPGAGAAGSRMPYAAITDPALGWRGRT